MFANFCWIGAFIGLFFSIFLIVKKIPAVYSLIFGAFIGGILCNMGLTGTVKNMTNGAISMVSPVLRILSSGLLVGALIKTGSATKIAFTIVNIFGKKFAIIAISLSTMIICSVGVFVDIAVITVAPIALIVAKQTQISKSSILLAMIGGGKAGNIISPNPNTIAVAQSFDLDLFSVISINIFPAIMALLITIILSNLISKKSDEKNDQLFLENISSQNFLHNISFLQAILGPIVVVVLLSLRASFGIDIDPLIALPIGALVCLIVTGYVKESIEYIEFGLSKVSSIAIMLLGTGTIAGVIKASTLQDSIVTFLEYCNIPAFILASLSGILFAGATASTTAGATIASQTFSQLFIQSGLPVLNVAAMIHAGSTVIDSLPHGSFFHATAGSVYMSFRSRLKLISFEAIIGLTSTLFAVAIYLIF